MHVEIIVVGIVQHPGCNEIDAETDTCNEDHAVSVDVSGRKEPVIRFPKNYASHEPQGKSVEKGSEYLRAVVAKSFLRSDRESRNIRGKKRQTHSRNVGQHVASVG